MILELQGYLSTLPEGVKAKEYQDEIVAYFEKNGFLCKKEVRVNNRGDARAGRIDIVASKEDFVFAIEVDRKTPRKKSVYKLKNYPCNERLLILRDPRLVLYL